MTQAVLRFGKWYWRRVKEFPLVVASFTLGGITVAAMMLVPQLAILAFAIARARIP